MMAIALQRYFPRSGKYNSLLHKHCVCYQHHHNEIIKLSRR
ncbi:hypothetical protein NSP_30150 [Nodularia spumigena CCY9414]|nr:hypothetical protein NSP_30150 [Nodularia spumigena CCY9414]